MKLSAWWFAPVFALALAGCGKDGDAEAACDDGTDDDGDGAADCADADCASDPACGETEETDCSDGADDDGDGDVDCDDSDCDGDGDCAPEEETNCDNGRDDDDDGDEDCADADCAGDPACDTGDTQDTNVDPENCVNGTDDDLDGDIDCDDADCVNHPACDQGTEDCLNSVDDDGDGLVDCDDADCANAPACGGPSTETDCQNGRDDDGDQAVDCDDRDCRQDAACVAAAETNCSDSRDDDGDGDVDCADSDCAHEVGCRILVWGEYGTVTVNGTDATGTATWDYYFLDPADGGSVCAYTFEANDDPAAVYPTCVGCDFSFGLQFTNGVGSAGCAAIGFPDGESGAYTYGYGFDADYAGYPDSVMYYFNGYGWYSMAPYGAVGSYQGGVFDWSGMIWNYYYY